MARQPSEFRQIGNPFGCVDPDGVPVPCTPEPGGLPKDIEAFRRAYQSQQRKKVTGQIPCSDNTQCPEGYQCQNGWCLAKPYRRSYNLAVTPWRRMP